MKREVAFLACICGDSSGKYNKTFGYLLSVVSTGATLHGGHFEEIFQYFVMERLLYRLGRSCYADQFVLKGALMFTA